MVQLIPRKAAGWTLVLPSLVVFLLVVAWPGGSSRAAGACATAAPALDSEEQAFLGLLNSYRAQNGRGAVRLSPTLNQAARWMANDLSTKKYFAHNDSLGRPPQQRITDCGYPGLAGENLAAGTAWDSGTEAMDAWKSSPGHNENMLRKDYLVVGIARRYDPDSPYGWYWVADFGITDDTGASPPPPPASPPAAPVPEVHLQAGSNLIAWGGSDGPAAQAFAPVGPALTAVYSWDAAQGSWNVFAPGLPAYVNTLRSVHRGDAYWVIARDQAQLPLN